MHPIQIIVSFLLIALAIFVMARGYRKPLIGGANVGEGFFAGSKTYKLESAITARGLLVKPGTDATAVTLAGAADIPLAISTDEGDIGDWRAFDFLGSSRTTKIGVASGVIAYGDFIVADAGGKVRKLPTTTGTYYIIGRALGAAAADGDPLPFDPVPAVQRVV